MKTLLERIMETMYEGRLICSLTKFELRAAVVKLKEDNQELLKLLIDQNEEKIKRISKRNS